MKILHLLGNGFDVNLELKTKYTEFYKVYNKSDSKSDATLKLKENIKTEKNWADLELALGKYTSKIGSTKEFIEIFEDIGDNLADYLKGQENKVDNFEIDNKVFFDNLSFPEKSLPTAQKNKITSLREKWANNTWITNVITFNYTKTFEKLIGENQNSLIIGNHHKSEIIYNGIHHVHGYIDNAMVMGVNDISQIENKSFCNDPEILNAFVKNNCNQAMQHTIDDQCKQQILNANLICIFGSSIGITDKLWWETIGDRLKYNCNLIIFTFTDQNIPARREYKKELIRNEVKETFLSRTNLTDEEKESAYLKIFVGVNRNLFKIKSRYQEVSTAASNV